jgi:outer membrane protein assembly factor BamA
VSECTGPDCPVFNRLIGSRIAVANVEVRFPLTGGSELGLIHFRFLPIELAGFADGGVAWSKHDHAIFRFARNTDERVPVFSTGVTARVNVLGAAVVEVFYAYPFQRPGKGGFFGYQISPGW